MWPQRPFFCVTWLQFQNQESGGSFLCVRGPGAFNQPKIDTMSQLASPLSTHSYHFTKKIFVDMSDYAMSLGLIFVLRDFLAYFGGIVYLV